MELFPFQTRARTIEHLGREQIADAPTAVSELWKNAYDAYAKSVALHIFDGEPVIAAVVDDGHGMTRGEFIDKWLLVGTETKRGSRPVPAADRNGLAERPRQGEKGIGRLSVARLGPLVLVLSKRRRQPYMAALVDWRLFENPYLNLSDLGIPVEEFQTPDQLARRLPAMFEAVADNVHGRHGADPQRNERVREAWKRYSAEQRREAGHTQTTADLVLQSAAFRLEDRHFEVWPVWRGESDHGTALVILNASHELSIWVAPTEDTDDEMAKGIRRNLLDTLRGFVDPYSSPPVTFGYQVTVHRGNQRKDLVQASERFGLADLHGLEHYVEGAFDENGVFRGAGRAFGRDIAEIVWAPKRTPATSRTERVGSFSLVIGTFQQELDTTTHPAETHHHLKQQAELYAGLAIYRDGLRVMPYGRPDADFFGIEERRSFHAGRAFWSYRRIFGRLALSREDNPNLRDKAGREGLIDNQARRELRLLVIDFLRGMANRYFNAESEPYQQHIADAVPRAQAERSARQADERRRDELRQTLRTRSGPLAQAIDEVRSASQELRTLVETGRGDSLDGLQKRVARSLELKNEFRLPPPPEKLGKLEEQYRTYRDRYGELCEHADTLAGDWARAVQSLRKSDPVEEARRTAADHGQSIDRALDKWAEQIRKGLQDVSGLVEAQLREDRARYETEAASVVGSITGARRELAAVLGELQALRDRIGEEAQARYSMYVRVLGSVKEGIDLDAAAAWSGEQRAEMETQVERLHALAQLGITVEIVGHELEEMDREVQRNLALFDPRIRKGEPFRSLEAAYHGLVERLRFLGPLQLSGTRVRETITGEALARFLTEFFGRRFDASHIRFNATPAFRGYEVLEIRSRVLPVFVNLINNSLYWVSRKRGDREIRIDVVNGAVVVSDNGPGIDPDDVRYLFRLFFSRRVEGRGVGLYLCRANLAAGGHSIEYTTDPVYKSLPGANFVIRFRGATRE